MSEDTEDDPTQESGVENEESGRGMNRFLNLKAFLSVLIITILILSGVAIFGYNNAFHRLDKKSRTEEIQLNSGKGSFKVQLISYTGGNPLIEMKSILVNPNATNWFILAGTKEEKMSGNLYRTNVEFGKLSSFIQTTRLVEKYKSEGMNRTEALKKARKTIKNKEFIRTNFLSIFQKIKVGLGIYGTPKKPVIVLKGPNEMKKPKNKIIIPNKGTIIIQGSSYKKIYIETRTILENLLLKTQQKS